MKNPNLYLPGFHLTTLRRKSRLAGQKLADKFTDIQRKSISQLAICFTEFIPGQTLQPNQTGDQSRRKLFSKEKTFWGFFSQILNAKFWLSVYLDFFIEIYFQFTKILYFCSAYFPGGLQCNDWVNT